MLPLKWLTVLWAITTLRIWSNFNSSCYLIAVAIKNKKKTWTLPLALSLVCCMIYRPRCTELTSCSGLLLATLTQTTARVWWFFWSLDNQHWKSFFWPHLDPADTESSPFSSSSHSTLTAGSWTRAQQLVDSCSANKENEIPCSSM